MKPTFSKLLSLPLILSFCVNTAFAGIGISVDTHQWDVGSGGSGTFQSPQITVTNTGDEPAKVQIRATNTQNWTLSSTPALNAFSMHFGDGSTWTPIANSNTTLLDQLNGGQPYNFFLRYQSPLSINPITTDLQSSVLTLSVISAALQSAWAKTYGGESSDCAYSLQQTSDGGIIVAGYTASFGSGSNSILVFKLSSDGTIAWQKAYGGTSEDEARAIQQTSDGGFIVAGFTNSFGAGAGDILVLKLNSDGTIAWQKTYGGTNNEELKFFQQTSDNGYIIAGHTRINDTDIFVLKLNPDGSIAWQNNYGNQGKDEAASIQQTSDGGFVIVGTSSIDSYDGILVFKLNSDGSIAWQKFYGENSGYPTSIKQTNDGGYIVASCTELFGAGESDILVMKLNSDGNIVWQNTYGGTSREEPSSIQQTNDGEYVIASYTESFGAGTRDILVLKLSSYGDITWQKTYGWMNEEESSQIQQTSDGGFIVSGYTQSFGESDVFILRLSEDGSCTPLDSGSSVTKMVSGVSTANASLNVYDANMISQNASSTEMDINLIVANQAP